MNQLVVRELGSIEAVRSFRSALAASTRSISMGGDDTPILKIDKRTGEWSFGEENTYVEKADLWAVHPFDIKHGYIAFDGREIAETDDGQKAEMLVPVTASLPHFDDLPELNLRSKRKQGERHGWVFQMTLRLVCVEGPNKGAQVVYKPTSQGGLRCIGKMGQEIVRRLENEDEDKIVPVVELDSRPYESRTYGPQVSPLMHIIEWDRLDSTEFSSGRPEADEAPATKKGARADKADTGRSNGKRGNRDRDEAREAAREARRHETDRRGEKVDARREEPVEVEGDEGVDDHEEPAREARGRTERRAVHDDGKTARRGRPPRDEEPVDEDRPARGRRARDEDVADEPEAPRGRRAARARDEDAQPEEDAPRSRGRARDEDDRPARAADAPRGRNAERGGRSRRD